MSRIGRKPIVIPAGVTVTVDEAAHTVAVKGPKGSLQSLLLIRHILWLDFHSKSSAHSHINTCSIIISLASLLGCVWFDAEGAGGVMLGVCRALPFYHCVKAARMAAALKFSGIGIHILIVAAYAALFSVLASFVFHRKMRADLS